MKALAFGSILAAGKMLMESLNCWSSPWYWWSHTGARYCWRGDWDAHSFSFSWPKVYVSSTQMRATNVSALKLPKCYLIEFRFHRTMWEYKCHSCDDHDRNECKPRININHTHTLFITMLQRSDWWATTHSLCLVRLLRHHSYYSKTANGNASRYRIASKFD